MRAVAVTALLVLLAFVAGCGGGGGGGTTAGGNGEASKPANEVLNDAAKAASSASSVHMAGSVASAGETVGIDLTAVKGKGATGSVTVKGAKVELVVVGGKGYLHAHSGFWKQFAGSGGAAIGQLLGGKWLAFPASDPQFGSFTDTIDPQWLFKEVQSSRRQVENKGLTTYKGASVVEIVNPKKGTTLYVAATGTPYPIALVGGKQGKSGTIVFDRWNAPVTLTAPKGAIDISKLGG